MTSLSSVSISNYVPKDLFINVIFTHLPVQDLVRISRVCKDWKKWAATPCLWLAFKLEELFPVKTIDGSVWKKHVDLVKYGLEVDDMQPPSHRELVIKVTRLSDRLKKENLTIQDDAGVVLLTIPKNLSLESAQQCAKAPLEGKAVDVVFSDIEDIVDLNKEKIEKTYQILITGNLLNETEEQSTEEQNGLISKIHCEIPTALEAITLIAMMCLSSSDPSSSPLLKYAPIVYSRCIGRQDDSNFIAIVYENNSCEIGLSEEKNGIAVVDRL